MAELHKLVEQLRFRSGVGPPALDDEAGAQLGRALEVWATRDRLTAPDEPIEPEVRADLIDLATLCADLRADRAAGSGTPEAIRDAIQILRDAEALFGPSPALSRDLRTYAKALGQTAVEPPSAEIPAPRTAWEHYDLGRSYLRSGEYDRAESEFQRAVEMQPGEFWPYFSEGICAYRLKRYEAAVSAFTICTALAPRTAPCYYNRALAYQAHGDAKRALADYSRALDIDPRFTDAALNRGILKFHEGRPADALLDFDARALDDQQPPGPGPDPLQRGPRLPLFEGSRLGPFPPGPGNRPRRRSRAPAVRPAGAGVSQVGRLSQFPVGWSEAQPTIL